MDRKGGMAPNSSLNLCHSLICDTPALAALAQPPTASRSPRTQRAGYHKQEPYHL